MPDRSYITRTALIVALGGFLMGFDASVISGVVGFIERQFTLTKLELGWAVSSLTLTATLAMMLAFTCCQTPSVYRVAERAGLHITDRDGSTRILDGLTLDRPSSESIFRREGAIDTVEVALSPGLQA